MNDTIKLLILLHVRRCILIFTYITSISSITVYAEKNQADQSWEESHFELAQKYIIPKYFTLLTHSTELTSTIALHCNNLVKNKTNIQTKEKEKKAIKKIFKQLYIDWATVQPITFGPISYLKRQSRMQYWPDKHNVGGKQLRRLLLSAESINLEDLQKKSVAVQGLPALEKILFSSTSLTKENCSVAQIISENIESIAQETHDGWIKAPALFINDFLPKNYDYGTYSSTNEIKAVLAKSITHSLALIEKEKLRASTQDSKKNANPRKLEAWRSGISAQLIHANIRTVEYMYLSVFSSHLSHENVILDTEIKKSFTLLRQTTKALPNSLYQVLRSEKQLREITQWKSDTQNLQRLIQQAFNKELGIAFSFNSLDGD